MRWLQAKSGARPGWVQASRAMELEIRTVWQEDELPGEVKAAAGWTPFTLSGETQEWIDSMSEVVDGGNAVYGRPKPVVPTSHRSLATEPSPVEHRVYALPPQAHVQAQPLPPRHVPMPDISSTEPAHRRVAPTPVRTLPQRVTMPEIGTSDVLSKPAPHVVMPDIGSHTPGASLEPDDASLSRSSSEKHHDVPAAAMPDIGGSATRSPGPPAASMPEIGHAMSSSKHANDGTSRKTASSQRRGSERVAAAMPEIGEDQEPPSRPAPAMPEIG